MPVTNRTKNRIFVCGRSMERPYKDIETLKDKALLRRQIAW